MVKAPVTGHGSGVGLRTTQCHSTISSDDVFAPCPRAEIVTDIMNIHRGATGTFCPRGARYRATVQTADTREFRLASRNRQGFKDNRLGY